MSKKCTPLWREAHVQVKMFKTYHSRATFASWDVEKVHAIVARSTFPSQNAQSTPCSDHFWKLRCWKSARRCGAKHMSKSKCTKHTMFGPLLEVAMSKKCTSLWREAHVQVKMYKTIQNIPFPDHFCKLRRWKSARRCGAKHMSKSKCTKHTMFEPLLEVEMSKKCTPLWREAHVQVKMFKTYHSRATFASWDVEKVHAVVARSTCPSQNVQSTPCSDHFWKFRCRKGARRCGAKHMSKSKCTKHTIPGPLLQVEMLKKCTPLWREAHVQVKMYKAHHVRTTFGSWDVEKAHAVVARSTCPSQNVQSTPCSDHFWKLRCRKSARRCGAKHMSKSKCTKQTIPGPLLQVEMSKRCTWLWREAHVQVKMYKTHQNATCTDHFWRLRCGFAWQAQGTVHLVKSEQKVRVFVAVSTTTTTTIRSSRLHYTTLHYITLHPTTPHYTTLQYTTLHYITLHFTTLHYSILHYKRLHYTTL